MSDSLYQRRSSCERNGCGRRCSHCLWQSAAWFMPVCRPTPTHRTMLASYAPSQARNYLAPSAARSIERIETTTFRILRDTALARQIKNLNQHQCQVCGLAIQLSNGSHYAEAHHIQPLGSPHDGPDIAGNIIVLCPNHHAMCDYGVIPLDLTRLLSHPEHAIDPQFIDYHNVMVYAPETPT